MTNKEYHEFPALSSTVLRKFLKSPAHSQVKDDPTDAMRFGAAYHAFMLGDEPVITVESIKRNTNPGKEAWASLMDELEIDEEIKKGEKNMDFLNRVLGKPFCTPAERKKLKTMLEVLQAHPLVGRWLNDKASGLVEWPFFAEYAGVQLKARPDLIVVYPNETHLIDLKTIPDASMPGLIYEVKRRKYDIQMAFYEHVIENNSYNWPGYELPPFRRFVVAQEKTKPYGVNVVEVKEDRILSITEQMMSTIVDYGNCLKADIWPSYPDDVIGLEADNSTIYD